ncbi:MAG: hypothetical protein IPL50_05785 [Chitinophagaceae bacterium]|nr:hypothetical protein [Chitinophagaceae bacterium]
MVTLETDDKYLYKEIDSYLFFPVPLSPWQLKPTETELNEAVTFSLKTWKIKKRSPPNCKQYIPGILHGCKINKAGALQQQLCTKTPSWHLPAPGRRQDTC